MQCVVALCILLRSTKVFVVCYPFNEILVVNLPKIINIAYQGVGWLVGSGGVMTNSKVNMIVLYVVSHSPI